MKSQYKHFQALWKTASLRKAYLPFFRRLVNGQQLGRRGGLIFIREGLWEGLWVGLWEALPRGALRADPPVFRIAPLRGPRECYSFCPVAWGSGSLA